MYSKLSKAFFNANNPGMIIAVNIARPDCKIKRCFNWM